MREIEYIKKACKITDKILNLCIKNIKNFKTEQQIYNFLKQKTKEYKRKLAFKPIVANNNWIIHAKPRKKKLEKGFLIIDFGVRYKGYCSDETRTIYIGKPSKKEIKLYNLILRAQQQAIKKLKPGIKCSDIAKTAIKTLGKYKRYFTHALGHGVGKKIHQAPKIYSKNNRKLKENTIFTIEPGIYIKNKFGIRIEDTILLKKRPITLTKTAKKLIFII